MENKTYIAIDLKSFYASVECVERGLDPLTTNLVVADESRTDKTICLAVSPSMKAYGISGRARLFEAVQKINEVNGIRLSHIKSRSFSGESFNAKELSSDPTLSVSYIIAKPRMAYYMQYSTRIYQIYLKYAAPEDIHVYSIDEVFIDATAYMRTRGMSAREFCMMLIQDVLHSTGITATAGIGTNLYLSKIAMDIMAKKMPADKDGVRIAELDEMSYRRELWDHRPLTDFWRVGKGYVKKLEANGIYTMGDIAQCSVYNETLLYKLFGINAELLIDHAWGWEPCRICDIKAYRPEGSSLSVGQVLQSPYKNSKARIIIHEMADSLSLDLVDKRLVADQIVLTIGYEQLSEKDKFSGEVETDRYGRKVPKSAHGSINLPCPTSSTKLFVNAALELFDKITDPKLQVRRMYVVANNVVDEASVPEKQQEEQMDFFTDYESVDAEAHQEKDALMRERRRQEAILSIHRKYGKNSMLKGTNFEDGATGRDRNKQIGGHRA